MHRRGLSIGLRTLLRVVFCRCLLLCGLPTAGGGSAEGAQDYVIAWSSYRGLAKDRIIAELRQQLGLPQALELSGLPTRVGFEPSGRQ